MRGIRIVCGLAMAAFLLPPMLSGQGPLSIDGTATYRERMILPPDAVFEATLEDVSRADAPATILGQSRVEQPGNPPIHFTIQYDPSLVLPNHIYAVRARISAGGRLLFTTDQRYQVLTQGHGSEIGVMMLRRVAGTTVGDTATPPRLPLRETYWKLVRLGEKEITTADVQQEANLVFHTEGSRVSGSGGCNRVMGTYTADASSLRFNGMASTRMACVRGTETETNFLVALEHVRSWTITSQELELLDESGKSLARFMAGTAKTK